MECKYKLKKFQVCRKSYTSWKCISCNDMFYCKYHLEQHKMFLAVTLTKIVIYFAMYKSLSYKPSFIFQKFHHSFIYWYPSNTVEYPLDVRNCPGLWRHTLLSQSLHSRDGLQSFGIDNKNSWLGCGKDLGIGRFLWSQ